MMRYPRYRRRQTRPRWPEERRPLISGDHERRGPYESVGPCRESKSTIFQGALLMWELTAWFDLRGRASRAGVNRPLCRQQQAGEEKVLHSEPACNAVA